jgi:hypothetical protein
MENSKMATLISAQQDDLSSGDEEVAELAQEARVSFGGSMESVGTTSSKENRTSEEAKQICICLEAQTGGCRKKALPTSIHAAKDMDRATAVIMAWRTLKKSFGSSRTLLR